METIHKAIQLWGRDSQLNVAVEEMSELIKEICKSKRGYDNREAIIDEIADVSIMLEQLKIIYEVTEIELKDHISYKLNRLEKRLETTLEN